MEGERERGRGTFKKKKNVINYKTTSYKSLVEVQYLLNYLLYWESTKHGGKKSRLPN